MVVVEEDRLELSTGKLNSLTDDGMRIGKSFYMLGESTGNAFQAVCVLHLGSSISLPREHRDLDGEHSQQ